MTANFEHQVFTSPLGVEVAPNTLNRRKNFFLSYNSGQDTTAIVMDNHGAFFVLNGDHRKEFAAAADVSVTALAQYFADHVSEAYFSSEHNYAVGRMPEDRLNVRKHALEVFSESDLDIIRVACEKLLTPPED